MPSMPSSVSLLAFVLHANATQSFTGSIVERSMSWAPKAPLPYRSDLDDTLVGKSRKLAMTCWTNLPKPASFGRYLQFTVRERAHLKKARLDSGGTSRLGHPLKELFPVMCAASARKSDSPCDGLMRCHFDFGVGHCVPSRRSVLYIAVGALAAAKAPATLAASLPSYLVSLQGARHELMDVRDRLLSGEILDPQEAGLSLKSANLGKLRATCKGVDEQIRGQAGVLVAPSRPSPKLCVDVFNCYNYSPGRPNQEICVALGCLNVEERPPSGALLLALRLFEDGVALGLQGDPRITTDGLKTNADDVLEKLNAYIALVETKTIM
eukprot:gnl/TRDRNA2_/TRDRNA2_70265_c0_seq1.p1 gnl/TRDRNA2_/TRDRNA2_70265_c0~~gnl/TRDRNA2_/TRDRNA2_70265_c0_seq1.p1  ORF type:complete len:324 (+),score=38.25 gnl/TRDRNA2_/TRDRNA2_70265_c0_seq1:112-1083(+)